VASAVHRTIGTGADVTTVGCSAAVMLAVTALLDLLAPPRCLACSRRAPLPWCVGCRAEVVRLDVACRRCGGPRRRGHPCWPPGAPIEATTAVYDYRGPVAAAVVTAKLGGAWAAWGPLADELGRRVAREAPEVDVVTWVTTPGTRARQRGVDHAELLARAVAGAIATPLARLLDAYPAGSDHDRYQARTRLPGTHVLLVDDVVTTGATAVRAATELRSAGADRVLLAVLARAGSHALTGGSR